MSLNLQNFKIALVFDWLTNKGGAERVNLQLHKMFPQAPIFTSVYNQKKLPEFSNSELKSTFIQKLPFAKKTPQMYLNLMPYAYECIDLRDFDIVISSSHSCAKGVITKPETIHFSYCHTPMRYAWDNWLNYIQDYQTNRIIKYFAKLKMHKMRLWDKATTDRVDHFIANSQTTARRIKKYYRKDSTVINPSIDCQSFYHAKSQGYYLAIGRLTPYKKFNLLVETFNQNKLPLVIAGTGILEKSLRKIANKNIQILGEVSDEDLKELYSNCEAFLFPQLEDFGITPLEAMASGKPVIAFGAGGALETVISGKTGLFFQEQSVNSLNETLNLYQKKCTEFTPLTIINHARKFDHHNFQEKIYKFLQKKLQTDKKPDHHINYRPSQES